MRHHYIPQFLLRTWAETTVDKKIEAFRLDLPGVQSSRLVPKSTAYEPDLYALSKTQVAGIEKQSVETDFLQHIDNSAANVLKKMVKTGLRCLTQKDRCDWVLFLMSLRLRTPDTVLHLNTEGPGNLKDSLDERPEEYNAISETNDPSTLAEFTEQYIPGLIENFGIMMIRKLITNPEIGNKILHMTWWLWNFKEQKNHLLLADRPCIFTSGIDNPDLVIALPLGPQKAFIATKTDKVANIIRHHHPKDLLMRINESSLNQAQKRVHALDKSPHRFICNRIIKQNQTSPETLN